MDALSESREVRIDGTHDDTRMIRHQFMEAYEVPAVQGQEYPAFLDAEGKHCLIGNRLPGLAGLLDGQDIMAEEAQLLNHWQREVFVRVEPGHDQADSFS
jgi:hypothetical protein